MEILNSSRSIAATIFFWDVNWSDFDLNKVKIFPLEHLQKVIDIVTRKQMSCYFYCLSLFCVISTWLQVVYFISRSRETSIPKGHSGKHSSPFISITNKNPHAVSIHTLL